MGILQYPQECFSKDQSLEGLLDHSKYLPQAGEFKGVQPGGLRSGFPFLSFSDSYIPSRLFNLLAGSLPRVTTVTVATSERGLMLPLKA